MAKRNFGSIVLGSLVWAVILGVLVWGVRSLIHWASPPPTAVMSLQVGFDSEDKFQIEGRVLVNGEPVGPSEERGPTNGAPAPQDQAGGESAESDQPSGASEPTAAAEADETSSPSEPPTSDPAAGSETEEGGTPDGGSDSPSEDGSDGGENDDSENQADEQGWRGSVELWVASFSRGRVRSVSTLLTEITQGSFVVRDSPAFADFSRQDTILVTAEAHLRDGRTLALQREAYWNAPRWGSGPIRIFSWMLLALAATLIVVFTGRFGSVKARIAVAMTYLLTTVALLLPLGLFIFVDLFEASVMARSPVAVVKVQKAGSGSRAVDMNQWAVSVGGIPQKVEEATPEDSRDQSEVYDVEGGLVIPLYVLIFAFLGGAVNMTRKVPNLQKKLADLTLSYEVLARGLQAAMTFTTETDHPVRSTEAAKHNEIRHQLILQYMYLVTAPILASVTYYLISLVETGLAESVPIIVLISFVAGLSSEAVLRTITDYADLYLEKVKATIEQKKSELPKPSDGNSSAGPSAGPLEGSDPDAEPPGSPSEGRPL